jgi:hypothetical protein
MGAGALAAQHLRIRPCGTAGVVVTYAAICCHGRTGPRGQSRGRGTLVWASVRKCPLMPAIASGFLGGEIERRFIEMPIARRHAVAV